MVFFLNEATLLNEAASVKKVLLLNEHAFLNEAASQSKVFSLNDDASSKKVFSIGTSFFSIKDYHSFRGCLAKEGCLTR